ncbi:MazG nucleotide pyrophosphohydrolase domain-containing protein [Nocardioides aequoreus]|uniref:MazG nucleotide pyrophosphohydrolase domain-containing protein n=1 Tax=Nocardioides aequoreus TaxID=397278 RepID=UPI00068BF010|nr:MazG nucleotide pyrophosphohydrolase domain-containing protein [Nocardioides aequoreus]
MTSTSTLEELVGMMRRLRAECGWKAAQTHRSLARHLLEETHELVEVLDQLDDAGPAPGVETRDHLREELGDVLLQVLFHAAIAEERGWFDADDVALTLRDKLLRRNPHVFGDVAERGGETDPARINELWEAAKAAERPRADLHDGIPAALPALARASKVLDRRERAGLPVPEVPEVPGGRADVDPGTEVGEELLGLVARARAQGVDPEQALRDALRRLPG